MAGLNVFSDNNSGTSVDGTDPSADGQPSANDYVQNGIAFFLNEILVSKEVLDMLSMEDVALVKTYVGGESVAIGPYNGVVAVYTKKGVSTGKNILDKSFAKSRKFGYAIPKEFYNYNYEGSYFSNANDTRITLYWNPQLKLVNNKAKISFSNNNVAKKIKIIVQGLDIDGRMVYTEQIIE
jgi:hypothetical protein